MFEFNVINVYNTPKKTDCSNKKIFKNAVIGEITEGFLYVFDRWLVTSHNIILALCRWNKTSICAVYTHLQIIYTSHEKKLSVTSETIHLWQ